MAKKWRDLMDTVAPERRARIEAGTRAMMEEMPLHELRQARQMTQETIAETLGTSQANVSKLERRTDLYVSTLRRYVEAMGGTLEITARFPDGDVRISQFQAVGDPGEAARSER